MFGVRDMLVGKLGIGTYRLVGKRDKSFWPRMMHVATENVQGVMGTHRGGLSWDPQPSPRMGRGSRKAS